MSPAPVGLRARAQIAPFALERPTAARAAAMWLAGTERIALMGGGLDLIDRLKRAEPLDRLVVLAGIADLRRIVLEDETVSIGAAVTHAALIASPLVAAHLPDLRAIWQGIASPRVRAAGTLGGNLMARQPHYDAAPALLALGATAEVMRADGQVEAMPLIDVPERSDIVLLALRIPVAATPWLMADRSLHPMVSVYLAARPDGTMRLVIGCAYRRPVVLDLANDPAVLSAAIAALPEPRDDDLASGAYRLRMADVLGRRLLARAAAQW